MAKPHEVLGIKPDASRDDVRAAYRRLALFHHPDKPTGDAATFAKINQAYEAMSAKLAAAGLFDDIFTDFAKVFQNS